MSFGTVGAMHGFTAFIVGVTKFLTLVASNWLLDVLAHDHPGVHDE